VCSSDLASGASTNPVMVHVSTRLVYGTPRYLPVDENHPTIPASIYGAHKLAIENYMHVFRKAHGLRSVIMRLSSPYGPNAKTGDQAFGILNLFVNQGLSGQPISIYGEGLQVRDYVFVDDVANALLWCGVTKECIGEVLNYGGERGISIAEAAKTVASITGTEVVHVPWPEESKSVETGSYCTDLTKIRAIIAARDQLPFDLGIERAVDEMRRVLVSQAVTADGNAYA